MGWTCTHKPDNIKDHLDQGMTWDTDTHSMCVLESALKNFTEYYAAVERTDKATGETMVFAAITLVTYHNKGSEVCFKDMDESAGPNAVKCPLSILKLLTPLPEDDTSYAAKWRESCYASIEASKKITKLKHGQLVKFKNAISFGMNDKYTEMYVYKQGRKLRFAPYPTINMNSAPPYQIRRSSLLNNLES